MQARLRDPQRGRDITHRSTGRKQIQRTASDLQRVGLGHDERLLQAVIEPQSPQPSRSNRGNINESVRPGEGQSTPAANPRPAHTPRVRDSPSCRGVASPHPPSRVNATRGSPQVATVMCGAREAPHCAVRAPARSASNSAGRRWGRRADRGRDARGIPRRRLPVRGGGGRVVVRANAGDRKRSGSTPKPSVTPPRRAAGRRWRGGRRTSGRARSPSAGPTAFAQAAPCGDARQRGAAPGRGFRRRRSPAL